MKSLNGNSIHFPPIDNNNSKNNKQKQLKQKKSTSFSEDNQHFYYQILPGNNTRVLINTLRRRPWWRVGNENVNRYDFIWEMYRNTSRYKSSAYRNVLLNHLEINSSLVSKKGLYLSIKAYCENNRLNLSDYIPHTYYIDPTIDNSPELNEFMVANGGNYDHIWILKPAVLTNRGIGIVVVKGIDQVLKKIGIHDDSTKPSAEVADDNPATEVSKPKKVRKGGWIVQSYIDRPLLIKGRKFDLRCYSLLLLNNGKLQAFMYKDGYIRTSSKKFTLKKLSDKETHLTNDAVQKHSKSYGAFEVGNKLNYDEWQECICRDYPQASPTVVMDTVLPQIEHIMAVSIKAAAHQLKESRIAHSFELLGYDFMLDADFKPYLIEINSNPCLEFACPLLENLITNLIENVFQVAVDPICRPPADSASKRAQECFSQMANTVNRFIELPL